MSFFMNVSFVCGEMEITMEQMKFYAFVERKNNVTALDIHKKLVYAIEERAPGFSTVKKWCKTIDEGDFALTDAPRSGRPCTTRTADNRVQVENLIIEYPRLSTRQISLQLDLNRQTIWEMLTHDLNYRKVCSVWVPHQLKEKNRRDRVEMAQNLLQCLNNLGVDAARLYAAVDETWINHKPLGTKQENKVWLKADEKRHQIPRPALTKEKSLLLAIYTANGKFNVMTLPNGVTINSERYCSFLKDTGEKWRRLHSDPTRLSEIHLQQDNARPHVSIESRQFIQSRNISLIPQPPYSPDFNMLDRWVFAYLKKSMRHMEFRDHLEVKETALQLLRAIPKERMLNEIDKLKQHLTRVIAEHGHYIT